jgi:uncharacterized protein (DUF58 family)
MQAQSTPARRPFPGRGLLSDYGPPLALAFLVAGLVRQAAPDWIAAVVGIMLAVVLCILEATAVRTVERPPEYERAEAEVEREVVRW